LTFVDCFGFLEALFCLSSKQFYASHSPIPDREIAANILEIVAKVQRFLLWSSPFAVPELNSLLTSRTSKIGMSSTTASRFGRIYEKHAPASPDHAWFWSIT
jgi:hypothetical protein